MTNTKKQEQPIYQPREDIYYAFTDIPAEDVFAFLFDKARKRQEAVTFVATIEATSEEHAIGRAYRSGLRQGQRIIDAYPLMKMHPVHRMLHLIERERKEIPLVEEELRENNLAAGWDKLDQIEELIKTSLRDCPEELNSPRIQQAFQLADTIEEDCYIGEVDLHCISNHWEDVERVSRKETEDKVIQLSDFQ
jgi:hypothetical protein